MLSRPTLIFCPPDSRVLLKAVLIFALLIKVSAQEAVRKKRDIWFNEAVFE